MIRTIISIFLLIALPFYGNAQIPADRIPESLMKEGMAHPQGFEMVRGLTSIGPRLTGSENYARAVEWGKNTMIKIGLESVRLQTVVAPHWVRGKTASASATGSDQKKIPLSVIALGGTISTPQNGITAEVIEVRSFEEMQAMGAKANGKIIFFNRPMDPVLLNTFAAYGKASEQRTKGAVEAAKAGGVAALVRSLTLAIDDVPHTGAMNYDPNVKQVPAAALSTVAANKLSSMLKNGAVTVTLKLDAQKLADVETASVIGDIRGSELPDEIVLIGGHLDSWDAGTGAHDDAAGCAHVLEAARLIRKLGLRPKRTIRVVLFANEENGLRGGRTYAAEVPANEKHIAAIESDAGGFTPLGFSVNAPDEVVAKVQKLSGLLAVTGATQIAKGFGGADLIDLGKKGVPAMAFLTDSQRYFDYHHSDKDTIDKVNPREIELGAISIAIMALELANNGL